MKNLKILFNIFDKDDKRNFIFTILISFISTFFQFFGLSTIVPLIATLSDPNIIYENSFVSSIYNYYNFGSYERFRNFLLYLSFSNKIVKSSTGFFKVSGMKFPPNLPPQKPFLLCWSIKGIPFLSFIVNLFYLF